MYGSTADKLQVINHVYDNFRLQTISSRPKCIYASDSHARHVVQKCFTVNAETVPELREALARIVNLVLYSGGQVRPEFQHLDGERNKAWHVLKEMRNYQEHLRPSVKQHAGGSGPKKGKGKGKAKGKGKGECQRRR